MRPFFTIQKSVSNATKLVFLHQTFHSILSVLSYLTKPNQTKTLPNLQPMSLPATHLKPTYLPPNCHIQPKNLPIHLVFSHLAITLSYHYLMQPYQFWDIKSIITL